MSRKGKKIILNKRAFVILFFHKPSNYTLSPKHNTLVFQALNPSSKAFSHKKSTYRTHYQQNPLHTRKKRLSLRDEKFRLFTYK